jgi:hypothetical protein
MTGPGAPAAVAQSKASDPIERSAYWFACAAAGFILLMTSVVVRAADNTDSVDPETGTILVFGSVAFCFGLCALFFERAMTSCMDSELMVIMFGIIEFAMGIATLLTVFFGDYETANYVLSGMLLMVAGGMVMTSHVKSIKESFDSLSERERNGSHSVILVVLLTLFVVVASNLVANKANLQIVRTYRGWSCGVGVICLFLSLLLLFIPGVCGSLQTPLYALLTVVLVVSAGVFPAAEGLVIGKPVSYSVILYCSAAFAALITRDMMRRN